MKTRASKHYWLLLAWLILPAFAIADDEFKKNISKSFSAAEVSQLVLKNKFGDVDLITSETNSVDIDVTIVVEADDQNEANKIFDAISISIRQEGSAIFAETSIKERNNKVKFKINYKVKMPLKIETDVTNKFGGLYANELVGFHDLKIGYGNLKVDRLINKKEMKRASVYLAYSKGKIETCKWLNLDIKYSKLEINESQALLLNSKYSKVTVEKSSSIVAVSKYDSRYNVGSINNIQVTGAYSNYAIGELKNKMKIEIKYSDFNVEEVSSKFKEATIDVKYGKVIFPISESVPYHIDANAKYGNIIVEDKSKLSRQVENNYIELRGFVGNENTERKVVGRAKYGSIIFTD